MATATNVKNLDSDIYAVIDLDSGTILGTNVVLVRLPEDEELMEEISSSDSAAWDYATENGIALTAEI